MHNRIRGKTIDRTAPCVVKSEQLLVGGAVYLRHVSDKKPCHIPTLGDEISVVLIGKERITRLYLIFFDVEIHFLLLVLFTNFLDLFGETLSGHIPIAIL